MTRIIVYAAVAVALLGTPSANEAKAADSLRLLATVAHQQAQPTAADAKASKPQEKNKKRPATKPIIDGIKGEATDDAHASEIDIQ